ncbi:MAG TPA: ADP-ribosylglycohydrolase family protein [Gemmatimonadetes bacterium]|nr:ADP-ribosylglycohydrolase family protein [Gemmatimonadota bacterium]
MPFSNNPSRSNNASGSNNASRFGKFVVPVLLAGMTQAACTPNSTGNTATFSEQELRDKIKGAWAAQTIGVTYGFPVEFRFNSVMVPDDYELAWYDGYLFETFDERPGVYDDIYMDLTFVQVFEDEGMDAPAQSFANAFANADYSLWFANQVARYNVLNGLSPPESGHWLNNPAADDIDFQIEADFAGIMAPGMVNSAVEVSDRVGHIMNYGDGWYGGVFVASMYSLAFVNDDIEAIVRQALDVIPRQSDFHQIISDVIALHGENPDDWKFAWEGIHQKWADTDLGPSGLMTPFNIDAKINAAWVVLGLLYGDGDFSRTLEIATRAGDDADCNPSSAAGILGAIYGYDAIPDSWKQGLDDVEALDFAYTTISLNDAYELSYRHALEMIERGGGSVSGGTITIQVQDPVTVPFEDSFENHFPKERRSLANTNSDGEREPLVLSDTFSFDFDGIGFAILGNAGSANEREHVFEADLFVDGALVESASWPTQFTKRRFYLFWKYALTPGEHHVEVRLRNPTEAGRVRLETVTIYGDELLASAR